LQLVEKESVFLFKENREELFAIISKETSKKLEIIDPDAIYVFNKQPYILFFDLTKQENQKRVNEIHKQVWSFDQAPLVIFVKESTEEYYNAFDFDKKTGKLSEILDKNIEIKCNFWNLQSGETLDWFYSKYKSSIKQKRVNQQLFLNIKQTIFLLNKKLNLEDKRAKMLILRLIFIRYLIDRGIIIDTSFIAGNEKNVFERRQSLSELIANPERLQQFFAYLNDRFNGVLFKNKESSSNELLTIEQSRLLSKLFDPAGVKQEEILNLFTGSKLEVEFQFDVFDFGIIPVELISGIYETLLDPEIKEATAAVYTPPFLVDYILTQTIDEYFDKNSETSDCKIFDPAMGSGIFLVQSFRRMVERELILNQKLNEADFGERIKEIAHNNLFGIDINEEAIDVACFSIYVALLDYQKPGNIGEYHFPTMKDVNFFKSNFFIRNTKENDSPETIDQLTLFNFNLEKLKANKLNFVLGNPPWDRNKDDYHISWLNNNTIYKNKDYGEKEIALSYLMRVNDFMDEQTVCSLIVTSTIFYNVSDTTRFVKDKFFKNYSVQSILDLSPVRRLVFDGEKLVPKKDKKKNIVLVNNEIVYVKQKFSSPALVIQFKKYDKTYSEENPIHFKSVKSNRFFNKLTKNLVIEKFDYKEILQKHFVENQWMFKVALYGNTLDYVLLKKLEQNKTKIIDLIDGKTVFKGAGILKGTPKDNFNFLIGLPLINNSQVNNFYTSNNEKHLLKKNEVFLESGRIEQLFDGTKILIKEQAIRETSIGVSFNEDKSVFKKGIFGINSKDTTFIKKIYLYLLSDLYTYYVYSTSGSWGTSTRPQIRLDDEYLSFPYIEPNETQKERLISLVDNLLKPYKDHYIENKLIAYNSEPNPDILIEINEIINEIYGIKGYEKDLIDYVLNVSRYQFQDSKQHLVSEFNNADYRNKIQVLEKYADVFIQEFSKIYDEEYMQVEVYEMNHFIAMHFISLNEKPKNRKQVEVVKEVDDTSKLFKKLATLSISKLVNSTNAEHNLFIQKDLKGFEDNSFYVIKPNEYKCWHRAMAWYDVAEFKEAIQRAELERIRLRDTNE
jgi:hypothetical protein